MDLIDIIAIIFACVFMALLLYACFHWGRLVRIFSKIAKSFKVIVYKLKRLYIRYRQAVKYLIFGVCTTLINILVKNFFQYIVFSEQHPYISAEIAWFLSVLFAFITNKHFVFESYDQGFKSLIFEVLSFFASRGLTLLMDLGIIMLFNEVLGLDYRIVSVFSSIIQIIVNFILSKFLVFSKKIKAKLKISSPESDNTSKQEQKLVYKSELAFTFHMNRRERKARREKHEYDKIVKTYASEPLDFNEFI